MWALPTGTPQHPTPSGPNGYNGSLIPVANLTGGCNFTCDTPVPSPQGKPPPGPAGPVAPPSCFICGLPVIFMNSQPPIDAEGAPGGPTPAAEPPPGPEASEEELVAWATRESLRTAALTKS